MTDKEKEQIRKETAKEILTKLGNVEEFDGGYKLKDFPFFKEFCKEYEVDDE